MPTSGKRKAGAKKTNGEAPSADKAAAKSPAKKVAAIGSGMAGVLKAGGKMVDSLSSSEMNDLVKDQLGNIFYDLVKDGWLEAGQALAELLGRIPLAQFVSLANLQDAKEGQSHRPAYDDWMCAMLLTAVAFSRRGEEIDRMSTEYEVPLKEIASFASNALVEIAGKQRAMEIDELMRMLSAFSLKHYFQRTMRMPAMEAQLRPGL